MKTALKFTRSSRTSIQAFSLAEVVMATGISALAVGGILSGYVISAKRAEWSAYSLAAQSLAMQAIEQTRACKWDPESLPPSDELISANFPNTTNILDIPISGTNVTYATNFVTITTVSTNPPVKAIQVRTVWRFQSNKLFTNTAWTFRGADN